MYTNSISTIGVTAALALASLCGLPGCADKTAISTTAALAPRGTFVGKVSGTDAYIAIVNDGSEVSAYICDGKKIGEWFHGTPGQEIKLRSADGTELDATITADGVAGTVRLASDAPVDFDAKPATGAGGLYRTQADYGDGKALLAGWIVLPSGDQRGIQTISLASVSRVTLLKAPALSIASTPIHTCQQIVTSPAGGALGFAATVPC
jgi:hypothetical protein